MAQQPIEFVYGGAVPLRRNLVDKRVQRAFAKALDPAEPRLKAVPSGDIGVNVISPEGAARWRIREAPFSGVEAVSLGAT